MGSFGLKASGRMNGEPWGYSVCESLHLIPSESCCFELFCHMWETSKGLEGSLQDIPPSPCTGSCWLFWTVSLRFNNSCWGTLISQGPAVLKYCTIFPSSSKEWSMWKIPENTEVQSVKDTPLALRYSPPTNTSPTTVFAGSPQQPQCAIYEATAPILSWGLFWSKATSLIPLSSAEMKNRINGSL